MGGVGFAVSGRSLTQSEGGATEVGSSSTGPPAARADGPAGEHWSVVEQCWAGQWEQSCGFGVETLVSGSARSAAVAQCCGDPRLAPAIGVHQPLAAIASKGAIVRARARSLIGVSYPTPLYSAIRRRIGRVKVDPASGRRLEGVSCLRGAGWWVTLWPGMPESRDRLRAR
jgi:hypothetical protein